VSDTPRPTASCGCGYDLVWINGAWEHDAAPSLWGGDHDPDAPKPEDEEARKFWDHHDLGLPLKGITVPPLQMDVTGEYQGNAYPEAQELRIHMTILGTGEDFGLVVEDNAGGVINSVTISEAEADGIQKVASTEHSLAVYEDDWKMPPGIERTVQWDLGSGDTYLVLSSGHIDEIAAWLRFATGEEEWDGGEVWEY
jgi:hypothetical protein